MCMCRLQDCYSGSAALGTGWGSGRGCLLPWPREATPLLCSAARCACSGRIDFYNGGGVDIACLGMAEVSTGLPLM